MHDQAGDNFRAFIRSIDPARLTVKDRLALLDLLARCHPDGEP